MSKELNTIVIELVFASGCNDFDQRSALGMVDRFVQAQVMPERQVNTPALYKGRDDLAEALVTLLEGEKKADQLRALAVARAKVNEPFRDRTMVGFQADRAKQGMVGSEKKNKGGERAEK